MMPTFLDPPIIPYGWFSPTQLEGWLSGGAFPSHHCARRAADKLSRMSADGTLPPLVAVGGHGSRRGVSCCPAHKARLANLTHRRHTPYSLDVPHLSSYLDFGPFYLVGCIPSTIKAR